MAEEKQYRILTEHEKREGIVIQEGDEFAVLTGDGGILWCPCKTSVGQPADRLSTFAGDIRRPIQTAP